MGIRVGVLAAGLMLGTVAFASDWFRFVKEEYCPGGRVTGRSGETLVCAQRAQAWALQRLKLDRRNQIAKLPAIVEFMDAMELGIWPDDSSDRIYSYDYKLVSPDGRHVGYADISGYANSEMGSRIQMTTRYNLKGQRTSISMKEL